MTLLALTAVICFGFAVYNLTCAFADIPTKRTSRMMLGPQAAGRKGRERWMSISPKSPA
ncbi:MAG: hypothetical protein ACLRJV_18990 [Eubacteriales bacterium]